MKHLNGGLTHNEIWSLPVSIRHFYIKMVSADIKRDNERIAATQSKSPNIPKVPKTIRK